MLQTEALQFFEGKGFEKFHLTQKEIGGYVS